MSDKSKPLRIGGYYRVSTDDQADRGESLAVQKAAITSDAAALGGTVVEWYGGSEHGTAGHARPELARLLRDAEAGKFDAVMVFDLTRFSRDAATGEENKKRLRRCGVRFFVRTAESDPYDPNHGLTDGVQLLVADHSAKVQRKKSIESRISRARKGWPAAGRLPFGRDFDRDKGWSVIEEKKALIREVAARYLAGESMERMAREKKMNQATLHRTLTRRSGGTWMQTFTDPEFGISETVPTPVPPLLDDKTIAAVLERAQYNKNYGTERRIDRYLLRGMVYCGACGYTMQGQLGRGGKDAYYRHPYKCGGGGCDIRPRPFVRCADLEDAVTRVLFDVLGDEAAITAAIRRAEPDAEANARMRSEAAGLRAQIAKLDEGRQRVIGLVERGTVTDDEADARLRKNADKRAKAADDLAGVERRLQNVPAPGDVAAVARKASASFREKVAAAKRRMLIQCGPEHLIGAHRRSLFEDVLVGSGPDGRPAGVYVYERPGERPYTNGRRWNFAVRGMLTDATGVTESEALSYCRTATTSTPAAPPTRTATPASRASVDS
ncbi:recombinase family protein [Alienimonas chondri]|uniref:Resolvase/invertase-type recombinase catalytic domain-containing protein n=1 Tax=Alienimonas chondri TaxID=2681879 RepID=A0ABX1VIF8_9PLAN|nr:recombinase family protein [Alienimonas chondri]NNJ27305.1 hypothetical protein [Alienimonas chondri]